MRCREARLRLTGSRWAESNLKDDPELLKHLSECSDCARMAKAAGILHQILTAASEDDTLNAVPMQSIKIQVEAQKASHTGSSLFDRLRHRPALGFGVVVVVTILAVLTLVPFRYDRTIGYEIAFAGVNRELVEEDERICDMLFALGLVEAAVDVLGCDTTCNLVIFDLKSRKEVQLVVMAFTHVHTEGLTTDVIPVHERSSGSLLNQVNERILDKGTEG